MLFGLNITALLCREEQGIINHTTRISVVEVSHHFLESNFVNEYDPQIKLLLQDVVLCRVAQRKRTFHAFLSSVGLYQMSSFFP